MLRPFCYHGLVDPAPIRNELTERLREALQDRLVRVALFGSRARNDWRPDSDYDVLMVVTDASLDMKDRIFELVTHFELERELSISPRIVPLDRFDKMYGSSAPFWKGLRRDEKVLWTKKPS
ncbi:MAG: nucleotidyltransferase domain-containing protein [Nitrospirae bacterium]|nr:nucleotidyltransferase domain-containing protein [Nitrospirota bacterium]